MDTSKLTPRKLVVVFADDTVVWTRLLENEEAAYQYCMKTENTWGKGFYRFVVLSAEELELI